MPYWSFKEYAHSRDEVLTEAGMLKKWKNRILGRKDDAEDSVAAAHAKRHKDDLAGIPGAVGDMVGAAGSLAGNIATGNVVGAAKSIWSLIYSAVSGGTKAYKVGKAAIYIIEINKHMQELRRYLQTVEDLDDETADGIIDAVFEVDSELFDDVSPGAWAEGTKRFAQGLGEGYDNIGSKIFAAVMAQVIREWVEKMGGRVGELQETISKLRGERRQKIDFLNEPEVAEAMAEFHPPQPEHEHEAEMPKWTPKEPKTEQEALKALPWLMKWPRIPRDGEPAMTMYGGRNIGRLVDVYVGVNTYTLEKYGFFSEEFKRHGVSARAKIAYDRNISGEYSQDGNWRVSRNYQILVSEPKWDGKMWVWEADPD